jgi:hypothetical protein
VDLIPFRTNQPAKFHFAGPEEIFRKAAINSLIPLSPTRRPKKKKRNHQAQSYFNFKACFSSLENNKELK